MLVGLLIYLLIGTMAFYLSTKAWNDDGYRWTKSWFIFQFIITAFLWPLTIISAIVLINKYGEDEADRLTTERSKELNMIEEES